MPYLLSILIWVPIVAGLVVLALGDRRIAAGRWLSLAASLATLILTVPLWTHFDTGTAMLQFVEKLPWIPRFQAYYALGIDGISLPLIVLTAFMTVPVVIAAWTVIESRPAQYYAAFLIMEGLMIGVFSASDALLFYFFWEAMLIPMFLIIGIWGGPRRVYATLKFFLYTFLGSVFMLDADLHVCEGGRLLHCPLPELAADPGGAALDICRLPAGVRGEGADVAGPYLVAGCARGSAHGRLGHSGGHHVEDGRLRLPAFQSADRSGCEP
jgi:NADH:ubiquinone oxidoreductase subunit 4 (subunit M)